ncbi:hypothetical protein SacxiDRAFT_1127 [Saccharomonospora xinjiangensis XJ-54]|uniref:Uncharacterized protein n=1 Tax=Saccharomonospora xinjiangensis XJ-54 TaxID=882086 RepID=I0UZT3_9PSEU|nr:hypothetical protein SacxiDRAFT_1127 [Saccharomonospora xinjiangensis XJ-54]
MADTSCAAMATDRVRAPRTTQRWPMADTAHAAMDTDRVRAPRTTQRWPMADTAHAAMDTDRDGPPLRQGPQQGRAPRKTQEVANG